jgi:hypothetical protein
MWYEVWPPFWWQSSPRCYFRHHCALDHSLVRADREVLYNDLLLSATSMVINPPTILEPAINLKTAKAIGVDRAASFLLRADNLIE